MFVIIGWVVAVGSVIGDYMARGAKFGPLWRSLELVIIGGAADRAHIVASPEIALTQSA
jgi:chemotaxis protein MotA